MKGLLHAATGRRQESCTLSRRLDLCREVKMCLYARARVLVLDTTLTYCLVAMLNQIKQQVHAR